MSTLNTYKKLLREYHDNDSLLVHWGVVVTIVLLFWGLLYDPFVTWKEARFELLSQQAEREQRLNSLKQSSAEWNAAKELYEAALSRQAERFFQTSGPVVAQGDLQNLVRSIAQKYQLQVSNQASYEVVPQEGIGQRLPISILVTGNTNDVVRFIADISTYPKLMVLEQMLLTRQRENEVSLSLNLSGYMLGVTDE
jgi:Tfp pilus assembly protein PilO